MLLPWNNVGVNTIRDALWYLLQCPPPDFEARAAPQLSRPGHKRFRSPPTLVRAESLWDRRPPRLFALLIGINTYKNVQSLNGCVPDVKDMQDFLKQTLRVPASRIQTVLDEQATRAQILHHIRNLAFSPDLDIKDGDPILIFYAGHGSESWLGGEANTKVQMLLPHDFVPETTEDENSQAVLDFTLGAMLADISASRGNNITVILDTCHSGSGTRKTVNGNHHSMVRAIALPENYQILPSILKGAFRQCLAPGNGFNSKGLSSHVLLSACMEHQCAREIYGRGVFSRELLQLLRTYGADRLTYKETIERLPELPMQNPQCEGMHNRRTLFDGKIPASGRLLYPVSIKGEEVVVQAGEAHGITTGARFDVFPTHDAESVRTHSFTVAKVGAFESYARLANAGSAFTDTSGSDPAGWALQTLVGEREDIRVFIPLSEPFIPLLRYIAVQMQETTKAKLRILLVEPNEPADLILHREDVGDEPRYVSFEPSDRACQVYGLKRMPHLAPLEVNPLHFILSGAAHFYWHLNRTSWVAGRLAQSVTVECTELGEDSSTHSAYFDEPILLPRGGNLINNGEMTVELDGRPSAEYGFRLTNHSSYPLYAALFYFDMSDLSISPLYMPPHGKESNVFPTIPPDDKSLTIGYGNGGWSATRFQLPAQPDGRLADVDVGYLKLFVSAKYVDYSHITQESPFGNSRGLVMALERRRDLETWDTMKVSVILRRKAVESV